MRNTEFPPIMREICKAINYKARSADLRTRRNMALKASRLSDKAFYEDLSLPSQQWVNEAIEAIEKDRPIPHFRPDVPDPATIVRKPGESKRGAMFRSLIEHADWSPSEWQESMIISKLAPNFDTIRASKYLFMSVLMALRDSDCLNDKGRALTSRPLFQFNKLAKRKKKQ